MIITNVVGAFKMNKNWCIFILLLLIQQNTICFKSSLCFNPYNWFSKICLIPSSLIELISRYSFATQSRLNAVENDLRANIQNLTSVKGERLQLLINNHKEKQSRGFKILKEEIYKQSNEFAQIEKSFRENQENFKKQISNAQEESLKIRRNLSEINQIETRLREQIEESSEDNIAFEKKLIELVILKNGLEQKMKSSEEKCKIMEVMVANFEEQAKNINNLIRKHLGLSVSKNITAPEKKFYVEKGMISRSPVQLTTTNFTDFLHG